jgi:hypothetical protein
VLIIFVITRLAKPGSLGQNVSSKRRFLPNERATSRASVEPGPATQPEGRRKVLAVPCRQCQADRHESRITYTSWTNPIWHGDLALVKRRIKRQNAGTSGRNKRCQCAFRTPGKTSPFVPTDQIGHAAKWRTEGFWISLFEDERTQAEAPIPMQDMIDCFVTWAQLRPDVRAGVVLGSWARNDMPADTCLILIWS